MVKPDTRGEDSGRKQRGSSQAGLVAVLLFAHAANAAELKQEAVKAWNDYIQTANSRTRNRLRPGQTFLWTDEVAERSRRVHAGEIVTSPMTPQTPEHVPSGLIHHWVGAAFFPNVRVREVFSVVRDYDRYKDYYCPNVVDSKTLWKSRSEDTFSTLIMNESVLARTALDSDYRASYFQLDAHRWYSVLRTTRVQQIAEYGQPSEHKMAVGQGGGYIWGVYSFTRFEERDGGVYVEVEAMVLSRDIPFLIQWLVDPMVRRVARSSLETSLQQTRSAVGANAGARTVQARPATSTSIR